MIHKSDNIQDLFAALGKAQSEFDPILKDSKNPLYNSKYADLDGVIKATQHILLNNNLVISQPPVSDLGIKGVGVSTILVHTLTGQYIGSDLLLPAIGYGKDKSERYDAQTGTAAVTYARRTAYLGIIGMSAEDNDGNSVSKETKETKEVSRPKAPVRAEIPKESASATVETVPTAVETEKSADANPGSTAIPTLQELDGYRSRFDKLVDVLSTSGLKSSKGLPLQKKVLLYLLKTTEKDSHEKITVGEWDNFFQQASFISDNGEDMKTLVNAVNLAVNGKGE